MAGTIESQQKRGELDLSDTKMVGLINKLSPGNYLIHLTSASGH